MTKRSTEKGNSIPKKGCAFSKRNGIEPTASPQDPTCPALFISGPATGQGKTTVSVALARLHARAGRIVRVFKCGQDFLDPVWLSLASGAPVHQLDLWLSGEAECGRRLWQAAGEADLIIVEGVMGLFDGQPSSADLAIAFSIPVVAVVDAWAMAQTFGAVAMGLRDYMQGLPWAGVLANRVAGAAHARMLQYGLRDPHDWLGGLPHDAAMGMPERHLGLVSASQLDDPNGRLDRAADALRDTVLGSLTVADLRKWAVNFTAPGIADQMPPLLAGCTIAVARDAAFCFIYDANITVLKELGATVVFMSPLVDTQLPECDAVWLPGGYPELHAAALSRNRDFRESLRAHVLHDRPVWAECGGLMSLFESILTADGISHPIWGVLPGQVRMQEKLVALGPHEVSLTAGTLRGHTYHHSHCTTTLAPAGFTRAAAASETNREAIYVIGNTRGSYLHAYFGSSPAATAQLFKPGKIL
jgi:cobyrinic acid a,c-diamide synthase